MGCGQRFSSRQIALPLLLGVSLGGPALANTSEAHRDTTAPRQATASVDRAAGAHAHLPGSRLQGEASLRFFGMRIYHARLWVGPNFQSQAPTEHPSVLELEYLRDFKGADIAERSLKEMQRAGALPQAQAQRWLSQMRSIFPDVQAGDRLSGRFQPGRGMSFWHNDRPAGQVEDAEFARAFLGIWLAPTTSEPAMRVALLGLREPRNDAGGR